MADLSLTDAEVRTLCEAINSAHNGANFHSMGELESGSAKGFAQGEKEFRFVGQIRKAVPARIWTGLQAEQNLAQAAKLREQADKLEREASAP